MNEKKKPVFVREFMEISHQLSQSSTLRDGCFEINIPREYAGQLGQTKFGWLQGVLLLTNEKKKTHFCLGIRGDFSRTFLVLDFE